MIHAAVIPMHTAMKRVYATFHPYVRFVLYAKWFGGKQASHVERKNA